MKNIINTFPPTDQDLWKARLEKDLKGITFETLISQDANGLNIAPFYTKKDVPTTALSFDSNPDWDIVSKVIVKDAKDANTIGLQLLENGVNGLHFLLNGAVDFDVLFANIHLPSIYVKLQWDDLKIDYLKSLQVYISKQGFDWDSLPLHIDYHPIMETLQHNKDFKLESWKQIISLLGKQANITIDGILLRNAGTATANTIALLASQLNEYIELIRSNEIQHQISKLYVNYAVGTKIFEEIASLRALKILIDTILRNQNMQHVTVHIHVETSSIYKTNLDIYSNLLRDTIAAIGGVLGGCTSMCVINFDHDFNNNFSYRMAKNIQLILKDEAYFNRVADVSSGSYYMEQRTDEIANKAWKQFKELEQSGGFLSSKLTIEQIIKEDATKLIKQFKNGEEILIGVNKYPNPNDKAISSAAYQPKHVLEPINITLAIQQEITS